MSSNSLMMGYEGPHDTLAPYPWSGSVSWCLAEGHGNGDQRRPMSHSGSGRTLSFLLFIKPIFQVTPGLVTKWTHRNCCSRLHSPAVTELTEHQTNVIYCMCHAQTLTNLHTGNYTSVTLCMTMKTAGTRLKRYQGIPCRIVKELTKVCL